MTIQTKDAGLRLRVEKGLRQEFIDVCRAQGKPAAQVLREFMREYIERERGKSQGSLFEGPGRRKAAGRRGDKG